MRILPAAKHIEHGIAGLDHPGFKRFGEAVALGAVRGLQLARGEVAAFLDGHGMRDIVLVEIPDGFLVQGLVTGGGSSSAWSDTVGTITKETFQFLDDDIVTVTTALANRGVRVVLAGTDTDFRGEPFGCMPQLRRSARHAVRERTSSAR